MKPIPPHLLPLAFYAPHQAWCLSEYGSCRHDPAGAEPLRADLAGANLTDVDLCGAHLSKANLSRANLSKANLSKAILADADLSKANLSKANLSKANLSRAILADADFSDANLAGANLSVASIYDVRAYNADLSKANLTGANLRRACLSWANLTGANLSMASLTRADLSGASGIISIGPVGGEGRIIYAVRHEAGPMVQVGSFWGSVAELRTAIGTYYADGSGREQYRAAYLAACDMIAAWGGVAPCRFDKPPRTLPDLVDQALVDEIRNAFTIPIGQAADIVRVVAEGLEKRRFTAEQSAPTHLNERMGQ